MLNNKASRISHKAEIESFTQIANETSIGDHTWIRMGSIIRNSKLGERIFVGFRAEIDNSCIESSVQIASLAKIGRPGGPCTVVSSGAWIGARAVINPGVHIGSGAIIGACALVDTDIPPDTIAVGRPAKVIKKRNYEPDAYSDPCLMLESVKRRNAVSNNSLSKNCSIGSNAFIDGDVYSYENTALGAGSIVIGRKSGPYKNGGLIIGKNTAIKERVILESAGSIEIGSSCTIEEDVLFLSSGHDVSKKSLPWIATPIVIGRNVIIGAESTIVGPVNIGDGAYIHPGSLVVKNVNNKENTKGIFGRA